MATFDSGATRTASDAKPDYEGFISPLVTKRFGQFMHAHRFLPDGTMRASDNWQLGISTDSYVKSLDRHVQDVLLHHRGYGDEAVESLENSLCAIIFNASGHLHEILKAKRAAGQNIKLEFIPGATVGGVPGFTTTYTAHYPSGKSLDSAPGPHPKTDL